MRFQLLDTSQTEPVAEGEFDDPQEGLAFLWTAAEDADHDHGELVGMMDGVEITL